MVLATLAGGALVAAVTAIDLVSVLFNDRTGIRCGSHTQEMLLQTYRRDTGEIMHDLSVPIYIDGKHLGGFRIGYHPQKNPKD